MDLARPFIHPAGLSDVKIAGRGLEFVVFKATSQEHGLVALRVPAHRVIHNVNDPNIAAQDLVKQELRVYELFQKGNVPVPKPYQFLEVDGYPAMLCEYVDDDGSEAPPEELGRIAALIHSTQLPQNLDLQLVAHEGSDALTAIMCRIVRRFGEFVKAEPSAAHLVPSQDILQAISDKLRRLPSCLLHMDLRDVNVRVRAGRVVAVIDWTNALIGPAAVDIFRILELGQPGGGFLEAYTRILTFQALSAEEEMFLRLDAALMLALVFMCEAPDQERREPAIRRVKELARALQP